MTQQKTMKEQMPANKKLLDFSGNYLIKKNLFVKFLGLNLYAQKLWIKKIYSGKLFKNVQKQYLMV